MRRALILLVFGAVMSWTQNPPIGPGGLPNEGPPTLPDGRNRNEMLLKADHKASQKDLNQIQKLTDDIKMEMEKNDRHVLSVGTLKKLDEIEKLAKRIRSRMKRF